MTSYDYHPRRFYSLNPMLTRKEREELFAAELEEAYRRRLNELDAEKERRIREVEEEIEKERTHILTYLRCNEKE